LSAGKWEAIWSKFFPKNISNIHIVLAEMKCDASQSFIEVMWDGQLKRTVVYDKPNLIIRLSQRWITAISYLKGKYSHD